MSAQILRSPIQIYRGFDDNAHVVLTLSNGGTAVIHASWSSHLGMNARGVIGTLGTAVVDGPGLWTGNISVGRPVRWSTSTSK